VHFYTPSIELTLKSIPVRVVATPDACGAGVPRYGLIGLIRTEGQNEQLIY
jgi:hypothetical protein